jgi:hypothetical protein
MMLENVALLKEKVPEIATYLSVNGLDYWAGKHGDHLLWLYA